MKKFLSLLALLTLLVSNANALTLEEKLAKVDVSYNKRIEKIDSMKRATAEKKNILKKHAQQNRDLKKEQVKELDSYSQSRKTTKK